jgi:hypothetical protein
LPKSSGLTSGSDASDRISCPIFGAPVDLPARRPGRTEVPIGDVAEQTSLDPHSNPPT